MIYISRMIIKRKMSVPKDHPVVVLKCIKMACRYVFFSLLTNLPKYPRKVLVRREKQYFKRIFKYILGLGAKRPPLPGLSLVPRARVY